MPLQLPPGTKHSLRQRLADQRAFFLSQQVGTELVSPRQRRALAPLSRDGAVAFQAESAHVGKIALATAFGNGENVVGVPEMAATAPLLLELAAGIVVELALAFAECFGVETALRTDAMIAGEHLFTQIGGVGAQFPFMDAGGTTECEPAPRDLSAAPTARAALADDPATRHRTTSAHTRSS